MLLTKYFEFPPASHFHCQADHGWHSKEQGGEGALERFLWLLLPFIVNMRSQCCNLKSKASVAPSVQQLTALSQANTSALTTLTSVVMATLVAATASPNLAKCCCRYAVTLHYNLSFTCNWKRDVTDLKLKSFFLKKKNAFNRPNYFLTRPIKNKYFKVILP